MHLFAQWTDRHMVDSLPLASPHMHIIYEHMFYSCWSFAITLTTWSRKKDRHAVPRWDMIQTMLITVWQKLCMNVAFFMLLFYDWIGTWWEFAHSWQIRKIFATLFFIILLVSNQVFNMNVNLLRKLREKLKFIAIFHALWFCRTGLHWTSFFSVPSLCTFRM